ncbi:MAG: ATP-binding protein, partial [Phycisphaerae bacterium]|nr:ATP-binding protein [Phycisphaerae bacterium]
MGHHFTNFVVAQSNRFAHAAARAVAEAPAKAYNPLIIWGGHGVGKTHLLGAIHHATKALHPDLKIKWVTGDVLVREFISCPDEGERGLAFTELKKDAYAEYDMLLIDDIQAFGPEYKKEARSALLDVMERMVNANKQVVMTAGHSPDEIGDLADLMRDHEWGVIVDIGEHETETALEIRNLEVVLRTQQNRQLDPIDYRITREWSIEHAAYMYVFYKVLYRGYIPPSWRESKEELLLSPVAVGDREWAQRNATHFG